MNRTALSLFVLGLLLLSTGCGSKGTVTGTVTYKGTPLPAGSILFVPGNGAPPVQAPINDGKYTVENVPAGSAKIAITSISLDERGGNRIKAMRGRMGTPPADAPIPSPIRKMLEGGEKQLKKGVKIPEQYADPSTSGLTYTVQGGDQTHDIDLK